MTDDIDQILCRIRKPLWEESRGFAILLASAIVIVALGAGYIGYAIGQQPSSIVIRIISASGR